LLACVLEKNGDWAEKYPPSNDFNEKQHRNQKFISANHI